MVTSMTESNQSNINVAIFFCRQLDPDQDVNRRSLEKERGSKIRFFPLPCSGRIEALHLLKALEAGAKKVYVVPCPEGQCRYGQGNVRARKRVEHARGLLREIGLPEESIELVTISGPLPLSRDALARQILSTPPVLRASTAVAEKGTETVAVKQV